MPSSSFFYSVHIYCGENVKELCHEKNKNFCSPPFLV